MGVGIETVVGYLSDAATATAQAFAPGNNQSFSIRAAAPGSAIKMESVWAAFQDPGYVRIRSPRLHDDVVGIKLEANGTNPNPLADEFFQQDVYSQDLLTVEALFDTAPTAGHTSAVAMQMYYDDIPGLSANFKTWAEIQPMIKSYMGVAVKPISNGTPGNWGAGVALNSVDDVFKANNWYALIGYITPTAFTAFALQGTDIGNLLYGAPGSTDPLVTRRFFPWMEEITGKPSIPVINSQNKASTLVQVFDRAATTTYPISLLFANLGPVS